MSFMVCLLLTLYSLFSSRLYCLDVELICRLIVLSAVHHTKHNLLILILEGDKNDNDSGK